jgi:hypothetical protein
MLEPAVEAALAIDELLGRRGTAAAAVGWQVGSPDAPAFYDDRPGQLAEGVLGAAACCRSHGVPGELERIRGKSRNAAGLGPLIWRGFLRTFAICRQGSPR